MEGTTTNTICTTTQTHGSSGLHSIPLSLPNPLHLLVKAADSLCKEQKTDINQTDLMNKQSPKTITPGYKSVRNHIETTDKDQLTVELNVLAIKQTGAGTLIGCLETGKPIRSELSCDNGYDHSTKKEDLSRFCLHLLNFRVDKERSPAGPYRPVYNFRKVYVVNEHFRAVSDKPKPEKTRHLLFGVYNKSTKKYVRRVKYVLRESGRGNRKAEVHSDKDFYENGLLPIRCFSRRTKSSKKVFRAYPVPTGIEEWVYE